MRFFSNLQLKFSEFFFASLNRNNIESIFFYHCFFVAAVVVAVATVVRSPFANFNILNKKTPNVMVNFNCSLRIYLKIGGIQLLLTILLSFQ